MSNIDHPSHYSHGKIEVAVAMDMLGEPWQWLGHALKYACRAPHKGKESEDVAKAVWCVRHAIQLDAQVSWPIPDTASGRAKAIAVCDALLAGIPGDNAERDTLRSFITHVVLTRPTPHLAHPLVRIASRLASVYGHEPQQDQA